MSNELIIGSRGSDLALWQSRWVRAQLGGEEAGVRIEIIRTEGDRALHLNLAEGPDKGMFTREIESALLDGRIDLAVHSLKDLPTAMPEGLALGATPPRAPVGDLLIVREPQHRVDGLPLRDGALVGTGSPRRIALLSRACPAAATPELFRGNVPTRIAKCANGEVDAVILARAGVSRLGLGLSGLEAFDLRPELWLPAPAQGALGLQVRDGDTRVLERLSSLDHADTRTAVALERGLLATMEAGCHAALGAWARPQGGGFVLSAGAQADDGSWRTFEAQGDDHDAMVARAAEALLSGTSSPRETREGWFSPAESWSLRLP